MSGTTCRRVWNKVYYARKQGKLIRPDTCERCGSDERLEAHHVDYQRPLDVRYLCAGCHRNEHAVRRRVLRPVARKLRADGMRLKDIARILGTAISTASEWCKLEVEQEKVNER